LVSTKYNKLKHILKRYPGVFVAFSGGTDSSVLLAVAKKVLRNQVIAVTAVSPIHPQEELETAKRIATAVQSTHVIIHSHEMKNKKFIKNTPIRCYYCKRNLFVLIKNMAFKYGYVAVEASNTTDLQDYRPGFRALKELNIQSPLMEAGLTKSQVRLLAKRLHLPNWNKPATACLASRIPYGIRITRNSLKRIEKAEYYLHRRGFIHVRVRDHFPVARIEVSYNRLSEIMKHRKKIVRNLKQAGYKYVTLDLQGYRTGSLNI
jgi:uncharacterized protein